MTRSCSAPGCTKRHGDKPRLGDKLSFHSFPLGDKKLLKKWVKATNRLERGRPWKPSSSSLLCSDHFAVHDFVPCLQLRKLREGSVPTWFRHLDKKTTDLRPPPRKLIRTGTSWRRAAGQGVPQPPATEGPCRSGACPPPPAEEPCRSGARPSPPPAEEPWWPRAPAEEPWWPEARLSPQPDVDPLALDVPPTMELRDHIYSTEPEMRGIYSPTEKLLERCRQLRFQRELLKQKLKRRDGRLLCKQTTLKAMKEDTSWQAVLDDCLTHREEAVRGYAVAALPAFTRAYVTTSSPTVVTAGPSDGGGDVTDGTSAAAAAADGLLDRYLAEVDSDSQNNRRGFALAVGSLPAKLFRGKLQRVLKHLLACCASTPQTRLWAECRRDGISAVTDVCLTVGVNADDDGSNHVCAANVEEIYDCLLAGLEDYTSDNRGDVGAWIREAAISGLQRVTLMLSASCPELLSEDMVRRTMTGLSQQAVEKIDRTRSVAGAALSGLLHAEPAVPRVPDRDQVTAILPADVCSSINWGSERETMPRLSRLLALPVYRPAVLLGLLVSAGGITERLVQTAGAQLQRHLRHLQTDGRKEFLQEVAAVMERHRRQDRVTLSVIRALEPLLNCGLLDPLFTDVQLGELLAGQVRAELVRCGEPHKLLAGVDLLCALMQFPAAVQRRCLGQLMVLLCHRFPRIRRAAASGLFETLLTHGELDGVPEEALERAQSLLGDTDWNEAVDSVRPTRDEVCHALGVPVPQRVKK